MALSLRANHLGRYRDVVALLVKYGRGDLVNGIDAGEAAIEGSGSEGGGGSTPPPEELALDLERLGPTFVKLGQLLSTRSDLLPPPFLDALSRLQDDVAPFPGEEAEAIVAEELGIRVSKAFSSFERVPFAAASLGQVHRAALRDGREVAVKVQRPGIRGTVVEDLESLEELADMADAHTRSGRRFGFKGMIEEFRRSMLAELDYRLEARNLETLAANLAEFDRIVVPLPVEDFTTSKVLTTELIRGEKITDLSPVVRTELPGDALAHQLFRAYLKQILVDGFVHADPHPGNVLLTRDGRLALIDLGMVIRIAPEMQEKMLRLLLSVSDGRADEAASASLALGQPCDELDEAGFRRKVAALVLANKDARLDQLQAANVVLAVIRESGSSGLRMAPELTMVGKALLNLEHVGRTLDPAFEPNAAVRGYAMELTRQRMLRSLSPGNVMGGLLELQGFLDKLPRRVNRILDNVAGNRLKVQVDAIDEKLLVEGFQKVANRISMGLVIAALIVGAALSMRVETTFTILGYPGLAMILFLVAAGFGVAFLLEIIFADRRSERRARSSVTRKPRAG